MSAAFKNTGRDADGNTNANKLFRKPPFFYNQTVTKLQKWNTVLLIHATTKSALVPLRDSNPGTTGRIVLFLLGIPNIKEKKEEKKKENEDGLFYLV